MAKAVGTRGAGMNQFNTVHAIASDAKDNIYVADRGNRRIQGLRHGPELPQVDHQRGRPWSVRTSPLPNQYLFSGDGNGKIYKLDMNGNLVGWAQRARATARRAA